MVIRMDFANLIFDFMELETDINESMLILLKKHLTLDEDENTAIKDAIKSLKKLKAFVEKARENYEASKKKKSDSNAMYV